MQTSRFVARQEPGNEWGIWDNVRNIFVSGGLEESEAQQGAANRNSKETEKIIENKC